VRRSRLNRNGRTKVHRSSEATKCIECAKKNDSKSVRIVRRKTVKATTYKRCMEGGIAQSICLTSRGSTGLNYIACRNKWFRIR